MPCWYELRALRYLNSMLARQRGPTLIDNPQYSSRSCPTSRLVHLIAFAVLALLEGAVFAQAPESTIRGTVTDATRAIVTNATVRVHQSQTGITRVTHTDASGQYQVSNL